MGWLEGLVRDDGDPNGLVRFLGRFFLGRLVLLIFVLASGIAFIALVAVTVWQAYH